MEQIVDTASVAFTAFAAVLAVTFWLALALLLLASRRYNHWLRRFGLMTVTAHAALFWTVQALLRAVAGYDAPTLGVTMWSRVLYAHLAIYVLGFGYLTWRPPPAPSQGKGDGE